jgi:hypothetical protein
MRKLAIITTAITTVAALSAIAAGMATAALPEFSPDNGKFPVKFTSFSGPGTLAIAGGNTIECAKDKDSGEIVGAKEVSVTVDFETCKIFGLVGAHSLGDPEGTILVAAKGELCYIDESTKEVGLRITPTGELHVEAPSAASLAEIEGSVIGVLSPVNTSALEFMLSLKQTKAGEQAQLECGGVKSKLEASENEGALKAASEVTRDVIGLLEQTAELQA